jgi:SNF2 family DNA or RNA helicase
MVCSIACYCVDADELTHSRAPCVTVYQFHGEKKKREANLRILQRKEGVLVTTYETARTSYQVLSSKGSNQFVWDYVILDEGNSLFPSL